MQEGTFPTRRVTMSRPHYGAHTAVAASENVVAARGRPARRRGRGACAISRRQCASHLHIALGPN